jgi:hypothetical protein
LLAVAWYVDADAPGSANGTSWTDAWTSLSEINWSAVQPGDTIDLSGGAASEVYYGRCSVGKSGTPGNLITIRGSSDPGHNGSVIIDGRDQATTEAGGLGPWARDAGNVYYTTLDFAPGYVGQPGVNVKFASPIQEGVKLDFYMAGSRAEVVAPGDWFIDDVNAGAPYRLYVYSYDQGSGYDPADYSISMPRYSNGFNLQGGRSYIRIENMTVRYSTDNGIACGNTVGSEFRDLDLYGHRITGIYFLDSGNQNNTVEDSSFANNGHCGIELTTGSNLAIRRSRFYSSGAGGGGNAAHIAFPSTGGAKSDITIENCLFEKNGSNAYSAGSMLFNAINIFNTSVDNLVIRQNTFYDWVWTGFLSVAGTGNYTLANNVFYANNSVSFLHLGLSSPPTGRFNITNNLFYGPTATGGFWWGGTEYPFSGFKTRVEDNGGTVSGNLFQDPLLADVSSYDLRLTFGSPCIDAAPYAGTNDSYDGTLRPVGRGYDIGAYEFTGADVIGQHVFYNNSKWDGHAGFTKGDPAANEFDDGAIATDKTALLPGQTGTLANYTSYPRGINGIMVDVRGLADPVAVADGDLSEFDFRYGNDDTPDDWSPAPAPLEVTVRDIGGGVHRITFIWADKAIPNKNWVQVTVKSHPNTGLAADDVFYFGNTVGENTGDFRVDYSDAFDIIWPLLGTPLPIGPDHVADINRDGRIDYSDVFDDLWPNLSGPAPLKPISPPAPPPALLESTESVFEEDISWAIELMWFEQASNGSDDSGEDSPLGATAVDGVFSVYYEE